MTKLEAAIVKAAVAVCRHDMRRQAKWLSVEDRVDYLNAHNCRAQAAIHLAVAAYLAYLKGRK